MDYMLKITKDMSQGQRKIFYLCLIPVLIGNPVYADDIELMAYNYNKIARLLQMFVEEIEQLKMELSFCKPENIIINKRDKDINVADITY